MIDPSWGVIPEITTARLQTGPGAAPMIAASTAWTAKAAAHGELAAQWLAFMSQAAVARQSTIVTPLAMASGMKMVAWHTSQGAVAAKAAMQAAAQADAHATASAAVVQLGECATNHITHAVLEGTNFLGINTVPIALNEFEYFVTFNARNTATMMGYSATTMANLAGLQTVIPPVPMTIPSAGAVALGNSAAVAAAGAPGAAARDAVFAAGGAQAAADTVAGQAGGLVADVGMGEQKAETAGITAGLLAGQQADQQTAQQATTAAPQAGGDMAQSMMTQLPQMASQMPQMAAQLPQTMMQAPQQLMSPMQSLMSPLQSMMSPMTGMNGATGLGYGLDATGTPVNQIGLLGASPFSNHPLAGGTGAAVGAGMLSGSGLPGAGGVPARSPFLASLTAASAPSTPAPTSASDEVVAGRSAGKAGAAPMGFMPAGAAAGRQNEHGGTVAGLVAPAPLVFADHVDNADDWSV